jgi:hypothetical protein
LVIISIILSLLIITHAILGHFFEDKGKTFDIFKKFATRAQNEFGSSMVKIRSDNGSEFRNTRVEEYCDGEGIKHEFSSTYTPQ